MRRLDPWLAVGLVLCGLLLFIAFYGDRIAPHEPIYSVLNVPDHAPYPLPPGDPFVFGSDPAGRDLLSVVLYGARTTLALVVLAGLARLLIGAAIASLAGAGAPRAAFDALSDVVSAVPSTIVAVLVVLSLSGLQAPSLVFVGALVVTGWAGPYRVVRAELARLRSSLFTEGARALGVRRREILLRHHLPHLVPVLALSASQQIAAALIALAELGVVGVFVGTVRSVNLINSLSVVRVGERAGGFVSESSEWSAMLSSGRSIENLYVTRWVILVPGIAIAFAVTAVSIIGIGIARHYRRRNLLADLRPLRAAAALAIVALAIVPSVVLPDRDAAARDRSRDARAAAVVGADAAAAFADAGLRPTAFDRTASLLKQVGRASITVTGSAGREQVTEGPALLPVLAGKSSGGSVDAPIVFAGWGISPADFPPQRLSAFVAPDFGTAISTWEDDYQKVDVRGKVAVILRLTMLRQGSRFFTAPPADQIIDKAIGHGAAAVIIVDSFRSAAVGAPITNAYKRMGIEDPISSAAGVPTLVVSPDAADAILASAGIRPTEILRSTTRDLSREYTNGVSMATAVPAAAHVEVPVARVTETAHSLIALSPARPDGHRLVIWAVAPSAIDGSRGAADALAATVRGLGERRPEGVAFVVFDPHGDVAANAAEIAKAVGGKPDLYVMIDSLAGDRLRALTIYDDLFLPIDHYADVAGAPHARTLGEDDPDWPTGLAAFGGSKYVMLRGTGVANGPVDLRGDAAVRSIALLAAVSFFAFTAGMLLGVAAAVLRQRSLASGAILGSTGVVAAVPSFFLAYFLQIAIIFLGGVAGHPVLPVSGFGLDGHLVLPLLTLGLPAVAIAAQISAARTSDVLDADFVTTARAKGLLSSWIIRVHVIPHVVPVLLEAVGSGLRVAVASLPIIELILGWNGIGYLALQAVAVRDPAALTASLLVLAAMFAVTSLLLDLRRAPFH